MSFSICLTGKLLSIAIHCLQRRPRSASLGGRGILPRRLLRRLDEECPYQVVLPRQQLTDEREILDFLLAHVGRFDMYVEDDYAAFVRYCFEDPLDAEIFRARFEPKIEHLKLAG
jgi:hypothetical protein